MIKFLSGNLIESSIMVASSTNAQYPLSNLKHDFRTKIWRSTSNADNIVFDFGNPETVDSLAIVDNWKNGFGVSTILIEANGTDIWTSPAFSTSLTFDEKFGIGIKTIPEQKYRFWRVSVTSTLGFCEIAYLFIGKKIEIETNGVEYGYAIKNADMKKTASTKYGQEYIDDFGSRKSINGLSFRVMNNAEMDQIFELVDDRRTVKPFILASMRRR